MVLTLVLFIISLQITFPSGAGVRFYWRGSYADVYIYPTPEDFDNLHGMIGSLDGNKGNDNYMRDGTGAGHGHGAVAGEAYVDSWRYGNYFKPQCLQN